MKCCYVLTLWLLSTSFNMCGIDSVVVDDCILIAGMSKQHAECLIGSDARSTYNLGATYSPRCYYHNHGIWIIYTDRDSIRRIDRADDQ